MEPTVAIPEIIGTSVRIPPGRVSVRLGPEHRQTYRSLYGRYGTVLNGLPVLRERDFDGRKVVMTPAQLEALNSAFSRLAQVESGTRNGAFSAQERSKGQSSKKLQYLS